MKRRMDPWATLWVVMAIMLWGGIIIGGLAVVAVAIIQPPILVAMLMGAGGGLLGILIGGLIGLRVQRWLLEPLP